MKTMPGPRMFHDAFRTALFGGRRARFLMVQMKPAAIAAMAQLAASGKIKAIISRTFPLEQTRLAFEVAMTGHVLGKVVVKIAD